MTNTKLLRELIKRSGLKINFIAAKMGISRAALSGKINNRSAFNQYEIEKLCKLLAGAGGQVAHRLAEDHGLLERL